MGLLTSVERFAQLCSHTSIQRGIYLQRDGDKQGGVRGFGCGVIRWKIPQADPRSSLLIFMYGHNSTRRTTPASTGAGSPGANVALKPRKQQRTAGCRHGCELFIRGVSVSAGRQTERARLSPRLHVALQLRDLNNTPQTSTEDGQHYLPANTTWLRTLCYAGAHKHACSKLEH